MAAAHRPQHASSQIIRSGGCWCLNDFNQAGDQPAGEHRGRGGCGAEEHMEPVKDATSEDSKYLGAARFEGCSGTAAPPILNE